MAVQTWTEVDFDRLSWHDCHVHAWAIAAAEHGQATLTFDIDFITAWQPPVEGAFAFRVAPATLTFFDVFGLAFEIDYTGFGVGPFSIQGVLVLECESLQHAETVLSSLPLVQRRLISFELIPLEPYSGYSRLFSQVP